MLKNCICGIVGSHRLIRGAVGSHNLGLSDYFEKLSPESVSDEAVDDKVDAGVENVERVGEVGETSDPEAGQEGVADPSISSEKIAADNVVQVGELPDVDNNSGRLATQEHEHDAEEDQGEIPFLPLNLWPIPLDFATLFVDVQDDLGVENKHGEDRDDGGHHDPGAYDVVLDVVAVDPKF